jgi:hypothetical protein
VFEDLCFYIHLSTSYSGIFTLILLFYLSESDRRGIILALISIGGGAGTKPISLTRIQVTVKIFVPLW